ncbi:chloramphenicol phosphotransferase CPT [Kitasatospora sp. NPDC088134]|uniref:chloramphenicol phosphotransferase CPT n=1 Tax=Kitasatospora sp. NPDC088134 TaxID=3364071 RepID=UPI00380D5AB9
MIVLNGGSSSGKSSLARALQEQLADPWLLFGIDDLIDAMPGRLLRGGSGIALGAADGAVSVGAEFRSLEGAWMAGVAATARAGARVLVDDVFLSGAASQARWRAALHGLDVLWVGVRCPAPVAAAREAERPDRTAGMAADQAERVHTGVDYDLTVDTASASAADCARTVAARLAQRPGG